jgi:hypothetical protein
VLVDGTVVLGIIVVEESKVVSGMLVVDGAVVSDANVVVSNVFLLSFLLLPPDTDSSISSSELGTLGSLSLSVVEGSVVTGDCVLEDEEAVFGATVDALVVFTNSTNLAVVELIISFSSTR